jgi:hypothetical protein
VFLHILAEFIEILVAKPPPKLLGQAFGLTIAVGVVLAVDFGVSGKVEVDIGSRTQVIVAETRKDFAAMGDSGRQKRSPTGRVTPGWSLSRVAT